MKRTNLLLEAIIELLLLIYLFPSFVFGSSLSELHEIEFSINDK